MKVFYFLVAVEGGAVFGCLAVSAKDAESFYMSKFGFKTASVVDGALDEGGEVEHITPLAAECFGVRLK